MDPFNALRSLENIFVDEQNPYFTSLDGVLYTKNFEEIVHYPSARTAKVFYLPKNVKIIRDQSFSYQSYINSLIFQNEITDVTQYAFTNSNNLRNFIFPLGISLPAAISDILKSYTISYYSIEIHTCPAYCYRYLFDLNILMSIFIIIS